MPGYADALSAADLWALADHVVALNAPAAAAAIPARTAAIPARAIDADRAAPLPVATWPGRGAPAESALFGAAIPAQGPPPASLSPAEASLAAASCGRCHAKQHREWSGSLHAGAMSPGVEAQLLGMPPASRPACLRCHAPLAEQTTDATLRTDAASCAGCHVRSWTRHGPPTLAPSLLPLPAYPLQTLAIYERADFCLPCHQLPPRTAVAGKPLLDTYREWLTGPYQRRGIQCQHCHMPNREHTFLGIHDPTTVRQALALHATARRTPTGLAAVMELENIGAGHSLPTTPTPALFLLATPLDPEGIPLAAPARLRIGRDITYDRGWRELSDTRIPPGQRATLRATWPPHIARAASTLAISVDVHPDDYYTRLYTRRLLEPLTPERRTLYTAALARAQRAQFTALSRRIPIVP